MLCRVAAGNGKRQGTRCILLPTTENIIGRLRLGERRSERSKYKHRHKQRGAANATKTYSADRLVSHLCTPTEIRFTGLAHSLFDDAWVCEGSRHCRQSQNSDLVIGPHSLIHKLVVKCRLTTLCPYYTDSAWIFPRKDGRMGLAESSVHSQTNGNRVISVD